MFIIRLLLLATVISCSTLSHNNVEQEKIRFLGGVYRTDEWQDALIMNRVSWFHGLTLYYEALFYRADRSSKFFLWFSETEKEYFDRCYPLLVVVAYSADPGKISHAQFTSQMEENGFHSVVVTNFARSLKAHPHYRAWNLFNHKVLGFCRDKVSFRRNKVLSISFPSFHQEDIEF